MRLTRVRQAWRYARPWVITTAAITATAVIACVTTPAVPPAPRCAPCVCAPAPSPTPTPDGGANL